MRVRLGPLVFPQFRLVADGGSTALLDGGIDHDGQFVGAYAAGYRSFAGPWTTTTSPTDTSQADQVVRGKSSTMDY